MCLRGDCKFAEGSRSQCSILFDVAETLIPMRTQSPPNESPLNGTLRAAKLHSPSLDWLPPVPSPPIPIFISFFLSPMATGVGGCRGLVHWHPRQALTCLTFQRLRPLGHHKSNANNRNRGPEHSQHPLRLAQRQNSPTSQSQSPPPCQHS